MNSHDKYERVSIIGLGYIGLPTAAVLANRGIDVIGVDINQSVVDTLNRGAVHIVEPELDVLVRAAVHAGKLQARLKPEPAQAFVIAVPTPFKDGHKPDLSYVAAAACSIAPVLQKGNLVILESTLPVGTTEQVSRWLAEARPDLVFPHLGDENAEINLAYCPERVLPGQVLRELVENDRIIGGMTPQCANKAIKLYRMFVQGECVVTDSRTAELVKLTENSFRDVNIAFANELSLLCDRLGIEVWRLIELANRHPRVNILQPGPGVGGHCIAVDPWFIVDSAPDLARLIRTAREVNDSKPHHVVHRVREAAKRFRNPVITCLGLAFKADIDDMRESPALEIVRDLAKEDGVRIFAVEPHVEHLPAALVANGNVTIEQADVAIKKSDIVVLLVNHRDFYQLDQTLLQGKVVIDTRGIWH